jgi:hypothetical protein
MVATAPGAHAAAPPNTCVASVAGSCTFYCTAGDNVDVTVYGVGQVQGIASCPGMSAHCIGTNSCGAGASPIRTGVGFCDLTQGIIAICSG